MAIYNVRFHFGNDHYETMKIDGESKEDIVSRITTTQEKWLI
ncbi:hypothetical protein [Alteribacter keqinensis]|nr:hypothetical protein [Alteribacter keqinensis]